MVEEEQVELIDRVETTNVGSSVEVIRAPLDRFMAHVLDTMSPPAAGYHRYGNGGRTVYFVYDQADGEAADALQSMIEARGTTWCLR